MRPAEKAPREDPAESLPAWARELLEQNGAGDTVRQTVLPSGTAVPPRQITWTAPGAGTAPRNRTTAGPADLAFREPREREEDDDQQQLISDAEIERTADRVYRIIEERLRRELRRSGR